MTRFGYVMTTYFSVLAIGGLSFVPATPRLIWNASASTPIGLYALEPADRLEVTDLVALHAPDPLARFLAARGYLPAGVLLLKRVLGVPGQTVCRTGGTITVDGIEMGEALPRDRDGRDLPSWRGCRRIADDELFLMNWQIPDSLDGRYFGPVPKTAIVGRAMPVLTDEAGDGVFQWFAPTR